MCFRGSFHQHTDTSPKPFSPATDAPTVPFLPFLTATAGQKRSIAGALLHCSIAVYSSTYGDGAVLNREKPLSLLFSLFFLCSSVSRRSYSYGLHPRDIRSVDPSLFSTNLVPSLLVYEHMILLNLGSLQAIAMKDCLFEWTKAKLLPLLIFTSKGGQAFLESLLPRLNPKNCNGGPSMPFELEIWLQLAYSWMRFSEEIKAILGTTVKHKVLLVSNELFFLFKFIMRKTCILFAYVKFLFDLVMQQICSLVLGTPFYIHAIYIISLFSLY
ncbi:hypothetical protein Ahy_A08g040163 isoform A [Arachis hypogaea]|uniref:Uncharacterized protein n=1 Tax=Arachis hypogaea TaxID=3818 RepID=A0A445BZ40_ARAHY|nr:hypothetical protein Ahy_A08g040163 isoform A [Arachis hypogaea]